MTPTTTTRPAEPHLQELPALTTADRVALSLGTQLILHAERHRVRRAARAARTEATRSSRAAARAEQATTATFERRTLAGPRW